MAKKQHGLTGVGLLAKRAEVCEDTIRNWERRGLIKAIRDSGNRRQFTDDQVRIALKLGGRPVI